MTYKQIHITKKEPKHDIANFKDFFSFATLHVCVTPSPILFFDFLAKRNIRKYKMNITELGIKLAVNVKNTE